MYSLRALLRKVTRRRAYYTPRKIGSTKILRSVKIIDKAGFGERFKRAFENATNTEIAEQIKSSNASITNYIKGRIPDLKTLDTIADLTGCSLHWLLTGKGLQHVVEFPPPPDTLVPLEHDERKIVEDLAQATNQSFDQTVRELLVEALEHRGLIKPRHSPSMLLFRQDIKLVAIPLIGSISADQPIIYFKEQKQVMVADVFLSQDGYQSFVLQIVGDAVDEGFSDGDYIICCDNKQPQPGQVVVAIIDGGHPTVKRIFFEGNKIRLQPANDKSPGEIYAAERVEIAYTVTGVQRNP